MDLNWKFSQNLDMFFSDQLLTSEEINQLAIVKINLPRKTSTFIKSSSGDILELLQFNEKYRSWFIDDSVSSSGKIFVASKFDPVFVFLQYLELHCSEKAQPLDQILDSPADIFLENVNLSQLRFVADQKGPDDLKAFVLNQEKALKWLQKKFELTKKSLMQQQIVSSGVSSANFVQSKLLESESDAEAVDEAAFGIISEYISSDFAEKLDQILGISENSSDLTNNKRKSDVPGGGDSKRIKIEEQENLLDKTNTPPKTPASKTSSKAKALEKAAKGSKSINSFFTKK